MLKQFIGTVFILIANGNALQYNFLTVNVDKAYGFADALAKCKNKSLELAVFDTAEKVIQIMNAYEAFYAPGTTWANYYIGASCSNGTYRWINGNPFSLPNSTDTRMSVCPEAVFTTCSVEGLGLLMKCNLNNGKGNCHIKQETLDTTTGLNCYQNCGTCILKNDTKRNYVCQNATVFVESTTAAAKQSPLSALNLLTDTSRCPELFRGNGVVNCSSNGTTCVLQCDKEYYPSGVDSVNCIAGKWSNTLATCQAYKIYDELCWKDSIQNPVATSLEDGTIPLLDGNYKTRTDVVHKCAHAAASRNYNYMCIQDNGWCSATNSSTTFKRFGSASWALCGNGEVGGTGASRCYRIRKVWKNILTSLCPILSRANGVVQCEAKSIVLGTICHLSCNNGFISNGTANVTCSANNKWDNTLATCVGYSVDNLGCWADQLNRAVPTLENKADFSLDKIYTKRKNEIHKCALAAAAKGFDTICVQAGGWCASSLTANTTYMKYGKKSVCNNGTGGNWANNCYRLNRTMAVTTTTMETTTAAITTVLVTTETVRTTNSISTPEIVVTSTEINTTTQPTMTTIQATKTQTTTTQATTQRTCSPPCTGNSYCNMNSFTCICNTGYRMYHSTCRPSCAANAISVSGELYYFIATWQNEIGYSTQKCQDGRPEASATCIKDSSLSKFSKIVVITCNKTLVNVLESIVIQANQTINTSIVESSSAELNILSNKNLTTHESTATVTAIKQLSKYQVTTYSFQNILQSTNNLLEQNLSVTSNVFRGQNESTSFMQTLDSYARKVELPQNTTSHKFVTNMIACEVKRQTNLSQQLSFSWPAPTTSSANDQKVSAIVSPKTLIELRNLTNYNESSLRFFSFRYQANSSLIKLGNNSPTISSMALSVGVTMNQENINITFQNPIKVEYHGLNVSSSREVLKNDSYKMQLTKAECFVISDGWRKTGDAVIGKSVVCQEKTTGTFASLFVQRIVPSNVALANVGKIGCVISAIGLLLTMIIYIGVKQLRERGPTPIMMNICGCLLVVYLTFLLGIDKVNNYHGCMAITILLHSAFLCAWAWMFINSINMYLSFVKVFGSTVSKTWWVYVIAYCVPFALVATNVCVSLLYVDKMQVKDVFFESSYRSRNMCWIHNKSLYFAFLLPVGLVLFANIVLFISILSAMIKPPTIRVRAREEKKDTCRELTMAISLMTMMGLTWVFGYLLLISDNVVYATIMSWTFTLFNSMQGLMIFIMMCVKQPKVRAMWLRPIINCCLPCHKKDEDQNSTLLKKSTASTTAI